MGVAEIGTDRHVLYRFYDVTEQLLYIGITANPGRRFGQHGSSKPWWSQIATIRMEVHPDRAAVLVAERAAIIAEKPLHNIRHATGEPATSTLDPDLPAADPVGEWPVAAGDVVALALVEYRHICHVGMIRDVSPWGPRIQVMDFWNGTFDQDTFTVQWGEIATILHARPKRPDEVDGWFEERHVRNGGVIWHTDPLGDFQIEWLKGRQAMLDHRAERRALEAGR